MDRQDVAIEWVPLDGIRSNPWQVRLGEDASAVQALARDIAERGLLQFPVGRRVGTGEVELAFGHTRLAAFRLLHLEVGTEDGVGFGAMPVVVRELSDQEMAEFAIAENVQRSDLTAIEKARALRRYCAEFGRTQAEAGERFGLSQSAVSHLMRLLDLPEPVQELVGKGELPERFARPLVAVAAAAPEQVVAAAKVIAEMTPEEREDHGAELEISTVYRDVYQVLQRWERVYKWPEEPMDVSGSARPKKGEPTRITSCGVCEFRTEFDGFDYCTRPACYKLKKRLLAERAKVERAEKAVEEAKGATQAAEDAAARAAREAREAEKREVDRVECRRLLGAAIEGISAKLPELKEPYLGVLMLQLDESMMFATDNMPAWMQVFCKMNQKEMEKLKPADKLRYTQALMIVVHVWGLTGEPRKFVELVERVAAGWKVKLARGWEVAPAAAAAPVKKGKK